MVRGQFRERIEKLRHHITATNQRTRALIREARGLRESSRERVRRYGEHQARFLFADRRVMHRVAG